MTFNTEQDKEKMCDRQRHTFHPSSSWGMISLPGIRLKPSLFGLNVLWKNKIVPADHFK